MAIRDPVTGFLYPPAWVEACGDPVLIEEVRQGFAVLTSSGAVLRRGYTTGSTAAAACKAAVLSLSGEAGERVFVLLPCGIAAHITVTAGSGHALAAKYSGDYPEDATAGLVFSAVARPAPEGTVTLVAGEGIGRFNRATPRFRAGAPAIGREALLCIMGSIIEGMESADLAGVRVVLEAPRGREVAARTLNPKLGISGGISVLGTTGLVEPWDDHLTRSVEDQARAAGQLVLTTGRTGLRFSRLLFPDHDVVLAGSRLREAIAVREGDLVLCGLPGLILRYIDPGILDGTGCRTVEELCASPHLAGKIEKALREFRQREPRIRVILLDREGRVIGESP
jgi:cobalt-precorrin-5B (C1)-methyltransferase